MAGEFEYISHARLCAAPWQGAKSRSIVIRSRQPSTAAFRASATRSGSSRFTSTMTSPYRRRRARQRSVRSSFIPRAVPRIKA